MKTSAIAKKRKSNDLIYIKILKAVAMGALVLLGLILLVSFVYFKVDISFEALNPIASFIFVLSCLFTGYHAGISIKKKGIIYGGICGFLLFIICFIVSTVINFTIGINLIIKLIICLLSGAIGGLIGTNKKEKRKIKHKMK